LRINGNVVARGLLIFEGLILARFIQVVIVHFDFVGQCNVDESGDAVRDLISGNLGTTVHNFSGVCI
jgi:hypothetical protein